MKAFHLTFTPCPNIGQRESKEKSLARIRCIISSCDSQTSRHVFLIAHNKFWTKSDRVREYFELEEHIFSLERFDQILNTTDWHCIQQQVNQYCLSASPVSCFTGETPESQLVECLMQHWKIATSSVNVSEAMNLVHWILPSFHHVPLMSNAHCILIKWFQELIKLWKLPPCQSCRKRREKFKLWLFFDTCTSDTRREDGCVRKLICTSAQSFRWFQLSHHFRITLVCPSHVYDHSRPTKAYEQLASLLAAGFWAHSLLVHLRMHLLPIVNRSIRPVIKR